MSDEIKCITIREGMIITINKKNITDFIQLLRNFNIEMHEVDNESIEIKINKKDKLYSNFIDDTWFNNSSDKINPVYLEIIE